MDHVFQRVPHFGRRTGWLVCACGKLHYGQYQAAAVKHHRLSSVYIVMLYILKANLSFQRHNNARLITRE